eukprot:3575993-Rhodomonas_salina.1
MRPYKLSSMYTCSPYAPYHHTTRTLAAFTIGIAVWLLGWAPSCWQLRCCWYWRGLSAPGSTIPHVSTGIGIEIGVAGSSTIPHVSTGIGIEIGVAGGSTIPHVSTSSGIGIRVGIYTSRSHIHAWYRLP